MSDAWGNRSITPLPCFSQQRIETLRVIFRQLVGEIADYAFSVQKNNRRRARHLEASSDAAIGVTRDGVLNAEFIDACRYRKCHPPRIRPGRIRVDELKSDSPSAIRPIAILIL